MGERTLKFKVEVIVEPDEDGFHAFCPALKGLHVDGGTREEAVANARDAVLAYVASLIKHGDPLPLGVVDVDDACAIAGTGPGAGRQKEDVQVSYAYP